jgi:hypothetical protein
MGTNAVVDMSFVSPNKVSCLLAPLGASTLLQVDLLTLRRRQETVSDTLFHCSEVVQEIVSPVKSSSIDNKVPQSTRRLLKEIEVISLYKYNAETDTVQCQQRSAAFLLPSQQDPIAMKLWEASRGRAVDVRFYDLLYTRR